MKNDFNLNSTATNFGNNVFKNSGDEKKKKQTKKERQKELKEIKKMMEEELKEKEANKNENTEYLELCMELNEIDKKIYLENYKVRKDRFEKLYYKAYAIENGIELNPSKKKKDKKDKEDRMIEM